VAFNVPNTLSDEHENENMSIELTFESMEDFSPAAIARKVEPLKKMLEARTQLSNLLSYMDGKDDAEAMISDVLKDENLMKSLMSSKKADDNPNEAQES
jgi:type VI secretion system protein ImpB